MDCAMRAIVEELDIDDPVEEVSFLSNLPPMRLFRPNSENRFVDVYVMYAKNKPPSFNAADEEDYEDLYDWYSFPAAIRALERNGDVATAQFLRGVCF